MSTSDQDGQARLTRKQLREIRLTGSTPVVTEEEAAAAAQPSSVLPRAAEPVEVAHAPEIEAKDPDAPLTRRQMRALEHVRAAAEEPSAEGDDADGQAVPVESGVDEPVVEQLVVVESVVDEPVVDEPVVEELVVDEPETFEPASRADDSAASDVLVSEVPVFEPRPASASAPRFGEDRHASQGSAERASETDEADELDAVTAERPMVGAAFGLGVKADKPVGALFDDLLDGGSSSGSHHSASTALIFTPSVGAGSLSGPIASTGELLITGTYALADGIGSQGRAHGTADGSDADAVLLDGELAPASSPTPIAASSAISTSKSAGEVIRPPVPDKGNKLMLTLAIVAGGLALALAATLIIAATTGVFG